MSSSPSVNTWQHPSALVSRVAETANVLAQNKLILLANSVTKMLDHNNAGAKISMDHRGRAYDNIFVERLWRTVKYEDVYPNAYETPREARIGINSFMNFYNHERPHSRLKYHTPEEVYWDR